MSEGGRDWRVGLILTLAVLAVAHSVIVALWLAPRGPVREAAGGSLLGRYVAPYFQQSWDGLGPSLQRVDEALWIRGRVPVGDGRFAETPWLDITQAGNTAVAGDVAPSRIHAAGRRLAVNMNSAMFRLGNNGRQLVLESFVQRPIDELTSSLLATDSSPEAVRYYTDVDAMVTRFASLYVQAYADEQVTQVQYRVGRRTVPERGSEQRVQDASFEWFDAGWRQSVRGSAAAQAEFDDWVEGERG